MAALFYFAATYFLARRTSAGTSAFGGLPAVLLVLALVLHGGSVWGDILSDTGTHLGLGQAVSLMLLVMSAFVTFAALALPVASLMTVVAPIAALVLLAEFFLTGPRSSGAQFSALLLFHITASISAVSVLMLAFFQALLLRRAESDLRRHTLRWARHLPPLETMERLLFAAIWVGVVLLIVAIGSGFAYLDDLLSQRGMIHHTVLLSAAALAYIVLLAGRHLFGWRGTTAVRWVIAATLLLVLGYFGSKFVIEVLLANP